MQDEFKPAVTESLINRIVENAVIEKGNTLSSTLLYIFKPALYPLLVAFGIFSILSMVKVIKSTKEKRKEGQVITRDSLNMSRSENSQLFNTSILYYVNEVDKVRSGAYDADAYTKLKKQGLILLQIDNLSDEQINLLTVYMNILDEWKLKSD